MEKIEMSELERELLAAAYADGDRIRSGQLFSYQKEALQQLRAAIGYLAEKYPGRELTFTSFTPATKFTPWGQLVFTAVEDGTFTATVKPTEDGYVCADTYYGALIRERYDLRVQELLGQAGIQAASVTEFSSPMGTEVDGSTTADELIALEPKLTRNTHLFVSAQETSEALADAVRQRLREAGLYGSYALYFVPESQWEETAVLEQKRHTWEKVSFNCFEIGN